VLTESYIECGYCSGKITEGHEKTALVAQAEWLPTAIGTPGVVSQHISDLYSSDSASSIGNIALEFLDVKNDRVKLQGWWNHRLGCDFKEGTSENTDDDIRRNMTIPYRRGTIPFVPTALLLGSDIGMAYARWIVAAMRADGFLAIFDWGNEAHPNSVAEIVLEKSWPLRDDPSQLLKISSGAMDAKYRKEAARAACLATNGRMFPAIGLGGITQRHPLCWNKYEKGFPRWFGYWSFNDHDAKSSLYIDRYKNRSPGICFPTDVFRLEHSERFVEEITKESLVEEEGDAEWDNAHPNHFGDALKLIDLQHDWFTRSRKPQDAKAALASTRPN
jgi:hypothetical protein